MPDIREQMMQMNCMKRTIVMLSLYLAAAGMVCAQGTAVMTYGLAGKIKNLTVYNFRPEDGNTAEQDEEAYKVTTAFNENGRRIAEYRYGIDGMLNSKLVCRYNRSGRLTQERSYDANGKLRFANTMQYDARGNEITRRSFSKDRSMFLKTVLYYDDSDNVIKETTLGPGKRALSTATWKYNKSNEPIEEITYDADNIKTRRSLYKYNSKHNLVEDKSSYYGITLTTTYAWDSVGHMIEECTYNAKHEPEKKMKYTYNAEGQETSQLIYNGDGLLQRTVTYRNEYDRMRNLVRKVQIAEGKETVIVLKEIVYY
jgi:hypothetical protein